MTELTPFHDRFNPDIPGIKGPAGLNMDKDGNYKVSAFIEPGNGVPVGGEITYKGKTLTVLSDSPSDYVKGMRVYSCVEKNG